MREIKFRAWDKIKKKMIRNYAHAGNRGIILVALDDGDMDLEPMQYTGLKDKNGVEIYEGDIISDNTSIFTVCIGTLERPKVVSGVYAKENLWGSNIANYTFDQRKATKCEVVGNIYENPELLQTKNDI